ncbi:hypothetical protein [Massilia soli]|uniref:Uncharacterized protein n=1 Tax=Massilia soli TaxID=2792854 RepID=A0ABS7SRD7_9BURK|nr:hypothetical protein [Massilia soli]MBZ2208497.1 hypothetical protein [Massilia soli]
MGGSNFDGPGEINDAGAESQARYAAAIVAQFKQVRKQLAKQAALRDGAVPSEYDAIAAALTVGIWSGRNAD